MSLNPQQNMDIVFREEFDNWGVLFDPETGSAMAIDPIAVFYWKLMDGSNDRAKMLKKLKKECEDVPEDAPEHLEGFIKQLEDTGFVSA